MFGIDTVNLKKRFYPSARYNNDDFFRDLMYSIVKPEHRVLDAGAGAGDKFQYGLKEFTTSVVGVDLDPRVRQNPQLSEGVVGDVTSTAFASESFDLVFARYVLEHVQQPALFLREMNRVLKPGGSLLFLTPNKWHYVVLIARMTPDWFHVWYNKRRGRSESDTFPTVYRLNSGRSIRKECLAAGFAEKELYYKECCPNYLMFSRIVFLLGVAYERMLNSSELFRHFRVNVVGWYVKVDS
jgi:ubiquinone/menaquinone biosynthesis C-methylase UbiE